MSNDLVEDSQSLLDYETETESFSNYGISSRSLMGFFFRNVCDSFPFKQHQERFVTLSAGVGVLRRNDTGGDVERVS